MDKEPDWCDDCGYDYKAGTSFYRHFRHHMTYCKDCFYRNLKEDRKKKTKDR